MSCPTKFHSPCSNLRVLEQLITGNKQGAPSMLLLPQGEDYIPMALLPKGEEHEK